MKRSIRLPFSLLVLIAVCTFLSCRTAVRRGFGAGRDAAAAVVVAPLNETLLLRLAGVVPGAPEMRKEVEELLAGNFPDALDVAGRHRLRREYRHLEDHLRRHPIRLRAPKDYRTFPEFRRSLRDWFRNHHFQPKIMSELIELVKIRPRSDTGRPYGSCAVVGNSGILLNHDHGELIDGHDLVIRLNNARVEGYHRHVGSKTDLSFVNSNILHLCARRDGCFCHPYGESVPIIMYICQAIHFLDYTVCNSSHKAPLLITDPRLDLLCSRIVMYYSLKGFVEETGKPLEEWGKFHDEQMFHYSSGMEAIMLALGICDQVSVFGFGKSADAKHHYHTNQKAELGLHDYEAEYAFYRDLVQRPQVIPFLQDSGFKVPPVVFYH